jgi:hypothetical protein
LSFPLTAKLPAMKQVSLLLFLSIFSTVLFAQDWRYDKARRESQGEARKAKFDDLDKEYLAYIGTSKLNAAQYKEGISTKDNDLRLVGLLFRNNNLDVSELYIVIERDGKVVDSSTVSCGADKKWKDFYITLPNVVASEHYNLLVYAADDRKLLDNKLFYIRKE